MTDLRTTVRDALTADDRNLFLDPDDVDAMTDAVLTALPHTVEVEWAVRWGDEDPQDPASIGTADEAYCRERMSAKHGDQLLRRTRVTLSHPVSTTDWEVVS